MSARNGDRARFHKDRKRRLRYRQRIQAMSARLRAGADDAAGSRSPAGGRPSPGSTRQRRLRDTQGP